VKKVGCAFSNFSKAYERGIFSIFANLLQQFLLESYKFLLLFSKPNFPTSHSFTLTREIIPKIEAFLYIFFKIRA
jgi:hypothetical protein